MVVYIISKKLPSYNLIPDGIGSSSLTKFKLVLALVRRIGIVVCVGEGATFELALVRLKIKIKLIIELEFY